MVPFRLFSRQKILYVVKYTWRFFAFITIILLKESDEWVAVKCLKSVMVSVRECNEVAKEIAVLKALKHPNILNLKFYEISKR